MVSFGHWSLISSPSVQVWSVCGNQSSERVDLGDRPMDPATGLDALDWTVVDGPSDVTTARPGPTRPDPARPNDPGRTEETEPEPDGHWPLKRPVFLVQTRWLSGSSWSTAYGSGRIEFSDGQVLVGLVGDDLLGTCLWAPVVSLATVLAWRVWTQLHLRHLQSG